MHTQPVVMALLSSPWSLSGQVPFSIALQCVPHYQRCSGKLIAAPDAACSVGRGKKLPIAFKLTDVASIWWHMVKANWLIDHKSLQTCHSWCQDTSCFAPWLSRNIQSRYARRFFAKLFTVNSFATSKARHLSIFQLQSWNRWWNCKPEWSSETSWASEKSVQIWTNTSVFPLISHEFIRISKCKMASSYWAFRKPSFPTH